MNTRSQSHLIHKINGIIQKYPTSKTCQGDGNQIIPFLLYLEKTTHQELKVLYDTSKPFQSMIVVDLKLNQCTYSKQQHHDFSKSAVIYFMTISIFPQGRTKTDVAHAAMLIIHNKKIELFEPHLPGEFYNVNQVQKLLQTSWEWSIPMLQWFPVHSSGIQLTSELKLLGHIQHCSSINRFCAIWSMLYAYLKVEHVTRSSHQVLLQVMHQLCQEPHFINQYVSFIAHVTN